MKTLLATLALSLIVAACGDAEADPGEPTTQPPTTQAPAGERGEAFVDEVELMFLESYPVQVRATITGNLPTPCHDVEWDVTTSGDTVNLDLFSSFDPDEVCAQVLEPFEVTVDVGSFTTGAYTLVVNGMEYQFSI